MADVIAALVTFNDIAICGSDGSMILVASVPVDASAARTAICKAPETGARGGAVATASLWWTMKTFVTLSYQLLGALQDVARHRSCRSSNMFRLEALSADETLDRDGGGLTAADAERRHPALQILRFECVQ
jgi:hypothetical protein